MLSTPRFPLWLFYFGSLSGGKAEEAMAPHSSTLAWDIPWTEEPGGLQSMGSWRVGHDWATDFTFTFHFHALEKEMAIHSSVLAWRIPGTGEPDGLPSMGSHRVGHDWSDLAAAAGGGKERKGAETGRIVSYLCWLTSTSFHYDYNKESLSGPSYLLEGKKNLSWKENCE